MFSLVGSRRSKNISFGLINTWVNTLSSASPELSGISLSLLCTVYRQRSRLKVKFINQIDKFRRDTVGMALGLILIRFDFFYRKVRWELFLRHVISFLFQLLRKRSFAVRFFLWASVVLVLVFIGLYQLIVDRNHPQSIEKQFIYIEPFSGYFRRSSYSNVRVDWNDYKLLKDEESRKGFGEHGSKTFTEGRQSSDEIQMIEENGHNAIVSNRISLDRSVPDFRSDVWVESFFTVVIKILLFPQLQETTASERSPKSLCHHAVLQRTFDDVASINPQRNETIAARAFSGNHFGQRCVQRMDSASSDSHRSLWMGR